MPTYRQFCTVARALDAVGDRWALLVVRELLLGSRRYTDLLDGLPGIGSNVLATRLRDLEEHGILARRQLPPPTPVTLYELTDDGGVASAGPPVQPAATITAELPSLFQLAVGRQRPDVLLRDGTVTVNGGQAAGRRLLDAVGRLGWSVPPLKPAAKSAGARRARR